MTITTYEGVVEKGKIRLNIGVRLPDNTKVYVVVPEVQAERTARMMTPRLAHPEQASDFKMEIIEDNSNARIRH
ncbi:MAG: hypothetical protein QMD04_05135 [Anaerolineales bacterium]|nr:hypothetical protein [Anaerolineales bacterium]